MYLKFVCFLIILSVIHPAFGRSAKIINKVIYGIDDRMDYFESSDSLMKDISHSTAVQILNHNLETIGDKTVIKTSTLEESGMCASERFSNQIAVGNCSGFLVGKDILVTAGHCINAVSDCENHAWIFDFANKVEVKNDFKMNADQVYKCTKILGREKDSVTKNDFAVIKLDRPVSGRTPLQFRSKDKPSDDAVFTVIGHPSGLPLKITAGADMRNNSDPVFFVTNADTYGGNSGSAVVDSRTGIVEGILVRGDTDYERAEGESCLTSVRRAQDGGRGEDVTRITNLIKFLPKI